MTTDENIVQPVLSRYRSASASVRELQRSVRDLQAERDTWRERWRQLMRDYEAVDKERDELEAERDAAREQVRQRDEVLARVRELVQRWDRLGSTLAAYGGAGIASVAVRDVVGDLRAALELEPTERCATCRCDTRYPTAVHVLDCGGVTDDR